MQNAFKILLAGVGALLLHGCVVCNDYHYLDFSSETSATPSQIRVPLNPSLRGVAPLPMELVIRRSEYSLTLEILDASMGGAVKVTSIADDGSRLPLRPRARDKGIRHCISAYQFQGDPGAIGFMWIGGAGCEALRSISFEVNGVDEKVLAVETLNFVLRSNGSYCITDSP